MIREHAFALERAALGYPTLLRAAVIAERGTSVAVVIGDPADAATHALAQRARLALAPEDAVIVAAPGSAPPGLDAAWLAGRGLVGGRPAAYVCHGTECSLPVTDPAALGKALIPWQVA